MNLFTWWKNRPRTRRGPQPYRPALGALEDRLLPSTTAVLVRDINPPSTGSFSVSSSNPTNLTPFNGALYFTATDAAHGSELWKTDGTAAGTVLVRDIRLGAAGSAPDELTVIGSTLYFTADDGANGRELWKSDGTLTGTRLVNDLRPGAAGASPADLTAVGSTLFFTAEDGVYGRGLWKSDGSTSGTVLVANFRSNGGSNPTQLTAVGSRLYLVATATGYSWDARVWQSDGTARGTYPISAVGDSSPEHLTAVDSALYYVHSYSTYPALMRADTTSNGVCGGLVRFATSSFGDLGNAGGALYFSFAYSGGIPYGLYQLQGAGVSLPLGGVSFWDAPSGFTAVNGAVYFSAGLTSGDRELWKYDGSSVVRVADLNPAGGSNPSNLTAVNDTLYFTADDGASGAELWQTDGTAAGTRLVRNISSLGGSAPTGLAAFNGEIYFAANDGFTGTELWKTRPNTAPTLNLTFPVNTIREGASAAIYWTSTDADRDLVTFRASGLPAGFSMNPLTGVISGTAAYSAGRPAPYTVTVTASDGFEAVTRTFLWSVIDVGTPTVVNPGDQGNNEGNIVSLAIRASDPYGDALTYSATGLPQGLSINSATGVISGTLGMQAAGVSWVTVTASDGTSAVATTFAWTVSDLTPPVITNPGPQRNNRGNTVTLDIVAGDPEGDLLTFTAVNLPPGLSIDPRTGRIAGTIGLTALARYDVRVSVSDGANTTSMVFVWTVG